MEQDIKVGSVGSVDVKESVAGESAQASLQVGPVKLDISAQIDNKVLLDLVVAKLPGGALHALAAELEAVLIPAAVAPAPAAPSA